MDYVEVVARRDAVLGHEGRQPGIEALLFAVEVEEDQLAAFGEHLSLR